MRIHCLGSFVDGMESRGTGLARRNDIAPYERREARRWTRVTDYVSDAHAHVGNVRWPMPGELPSRAPAGEPLRRNGRGGLLLPVAAVALAALTALWGSGIVSGREHSRATAGSTTSSGLVFGLCSEGGLTNCVQSGDSFYLKGKTVRIAGIEAPQLYGAACPKEAELGQDRGHVRPVEPRQVAAPVEAVEPSSHISRKNAIIAVTKSA